LSWPLTTFSIPRNHPSIGGGKWWKGGTDGKKKVGQSGKSYWWLENHPMFQFHGVEVLHVWLLEGT
jgi:hypothetical protein